MFYFLVRRPLARPQLSVRNDITVYGPPFLLPGKPPQQIHTGKAHRPAEQGSPLGDQKIRDGVHPADVFLHVVGGGLIIGGKDAGEILPSAANKVDKSEPAAHKEQPVRQAGPAPAIQNRPAQHPKTAEHRHQRRKAGQQIRRLEGGPGQKEHAFHHQATQHLFR